MVHCAKLGSEFFPKNDKLEKVVYSFLLNWLPLAYFIGVYGSLPDDAFKPFVLVWIIVMALAICVGHAFTALMILDVHTNVIDFPLNYFRLHRIDLGLKLYASLWVGNFFFDIVNLIMSALVFASLPGTLFGAIMNYVGIAVTGVLGAIELNKALFDPRISECFTISHNDDPSKFQEFVDAHKRSHKYWACKAFFGDSVAACMANESSSGWDVEAMVRYFRSFDTLVDISETKFEERKTRFREFSNAQTREFVLSIYKTPEGPFTYFERDWLV